MIRPFAALWRNLTGTAAPPAADAPRITDLGQPQDAIYAVGDVHGCRAELVALLDRITQDADRLGLRPRVILLGDAIDRGPQSAGVIDLLLSPRHAPWVQAILGNHESMMLDFLARPQAHAHWIDSGGFETLLSYGLSLSRSDLAALPKRRALQTVAAHIPDRHSAWLRSLPHGITLSMDGLRYMLTHAGYDPALPQDAQPASVLLWGKGSHDAQPIPPDLRLVQGHVITEAPDPSAARIRVDTGAYRTGRLSCLRIAPGHPPTLIALTLPRRTAPHPRPGRTGDLEGNHLGKH